MPLTVDQIVEETRSLSEDQLVLLVHRLRGRLHDIDPQIEKAWNDEAHRRLAELESGQVQAIPGDEVSARIRQIVGR
jgi:putative addiction module component (TIGR02574 family)